MRRAIAVLAATIAGLVMLLDFKSAPARSAGGAFGLPSTTPSGAGPSPSAGSPSGSVATPSTPAATPSTPAATPAAKPTTQPTPTPTPTPTKAASGTRTATGPAVPVTEGFRTFGAVQVKVTVSSGKITNLVAVNYPHNDSRSYEISQYSIPVLQQEVMAAQGTHIDIVSGATYTSDAYAQSVQAALDSLKF